MVTEPLGRSKDALEEVKLKCSLCGTLMSPTDAKCPRCRTVNANWKPQVSAQQSPTPPQPKPSASATAPADPPATTPTAQLAQQTAPPQATVTHRITVFTNCAWQRPDGRWLSSKEIAEVEELARRYIVLKNSSGGFNMTKLLSKVGLKKGTTDVEQIKARIAQIGIEFGTFQAYANSLLG